MAEESEKIVPLSLIVVAAAALCISAAHLAGPRGAAAAIVVATVLAVVNVVVFTAVAYATSAIIQAPFGPLGTAILKFMAIGLVASAIASSVPAIGGLLATVSLFVLLLWLLDLDTREALIFTAVLGVVGFAIVFLFAMAAR
ncbi:MAG: hypothetical protein NTU53_07610 [Planctomycetota bacterium]|nr:hypothetical protein [Planctomycetota bacterium]